MGIKSEYALIFVTILRFPPEPYDKKLKTVAKYDIIVVRVTTMIRCRNVVSFFIDSVILFPSIPPKRIIVRSP